MSKSKGNVINPMEMVSEYGSDALRIGLISSRSAGQSQAFGVGKVVAARNFCNKLWNIARYIEGKVGDAFERTPAEPRSLADHWILRELDVAASTISTQLTQYRFAEAADTMYHTIWDSVADWYIEASKKEENIPLLVEVLETCLTIAHPFAPFVTETIWQTLPFADDLLMSRRWPTSASFDPIMAGEFERLQALVTEARYVTAELPGTEKYSLLYQNDSLIEDNSALIVHLARLKDVTRVDQSRGLRLAASGREAWLDIDEETLYQHQTNLETRLASARASAANLEARLHNPSYVDKAPAALVKESRKQLEETIGLIARLVTELEAL